LPLEDRLDHSRSTVRGQPGMLMELHVWVGFEGLNVCTPISLSNPSPHEQPIETSQLDVTAETQRPLRFDFSLCPLRLCG
jgi:hypothetical protein